jgi:predicted nucleic acid-binding protein
VLVIDANVAVKWFVTQPGSAPALAIAKGDQELIAPDLLLLEAANAFWRSVRAGLMQADDAFEALSQAPAHFAKLCPSSELAGEALHLAIQLRHPVYDCTYLALARRENAPLVTADKRLAAAAAKSLLNFEVRLLGGA